MILIVDKNEADVNKSVLASLKKHFTNVIIANLPHHEYGGITVTAGDINIPLDDGSLLAIERKTVMDFLNSISDRHIFNQVEVMASHAKYSAIIVTGHFAYTNKTDMVKADDVLTEWNGKSVRAVINAIQFSGCPVIFCPESEYCNMIVEVYNLVNKPDRHQGIVKNRIITFPPVDARVRFVAQLPTIGLKLSDSLMKSACRPLFDGDDEYGSIAYALELVTTMSMIDKDLRPVGWGAKKILEVRKFLGLQSNEYLAIKSEVQEMITDDSKEETKSK